MSNQPNFVFIFPDQWRYDCISALGHPDVRTPFIDDMVAQGTTFTSAYSACPSCIATRASLISGLTPHNSGRVGYSEYIPWTYDSMMQRMRDGGYHTMCVGKTHFYPERTHLGFEELQLYSNQDLDGDNPSDYHRWLEREGKGLVHDTANAVSSCSWVGKPWTSPIELHPSVWTTDRSIEMIRRRDPQRPFFLHVGYHRPHPPYDPPMEYYQMYQNRPLTPEPHGAWSDGYAKEIPLSQTYYGKWRPDQLDEMRRCYYAQIAHLDYEIGRLLYYLETQGLRDNTYIIFSTDHGDMMGDHYMSSKYRPYEGSSKVPFVVVPPLNLQTARGITNDTPLSHMDMIPTFLDLAGIPLPEHIDGISVAPAIAGEDMPERKYVHGEHIMAGAGEGWQYITDGKEKFAWETMSGQEFFFDIANDPQELVNHIDSAEYQDRITLWRAEMISILEARPEDGLTENGKLKAGKILPPVSEELQKLAKKRVII